MFGQCRGAAMKTSRCPRPNAQPTTNVASRRARHRPGLSITAALSDRARTKTVPAFLAGSWMLYRCCEIAHVSVAWTIARARKLDCRVSIEDKPK
jgi:hypothetical protein